LVDLCRLHVQMIDMVAFDHCVISLLPVQLVQFVQLLVPLPKFLDHKLLEADYIHNVKQCLNLIKNENTKLVCDGAKAVFLHDNKHCFDDLPSHGVGHEMYHVNGLVDAAHEVSVGVHQKSLGSGKSTIAWMHQRKDVLHKLQGS
jgi:hypothetical protein